MKENTHKFIGTVSSIEAVCEAGQKLQTWWRKVKTG